MVKKGYIKTLEAVIAILLILGFVFTVVPRERTLDPRVPSTIESAQKAIIREISSNDSIRDCVIEDELCENSRLIPIVIEDNLPIGFNYTFKICDTTNCLATTPLDKAVYLADVFMASNLNEQNPRIVRIWIWRN